MGSKKKTYYEKILDLVLSNIVAFISSLLISLIVFLISFFIMISILTDTGVTFLNNWVIYTLTFFGVTFIGGIFERKVEGKFSKNILKANLLFLLSSISFCWLWLSSPIFEYLTDYFKEIFLWINTVIIMAGALSFAFAIIVLTISLFRFWKGSD